MAQPSHGEARQQDDREGTALEEAERGADGGGREGAVHFHPAAMVGVKGAEDVAKGGGGAETTEDANGLHGGDFVEALLEVEFGPEEMEAPISSGSRVPKQAAVEGSPVPHRKASTELGVDPGVEPGREGAERDPHTEPPGEGSNADGTHAVVVFLRDKDDAHVEPRRGDWEATEKDRVPQGGRGE